MHKLRSEILTASQPRPSPVAATKARAGLGGSLASIPVKRTESRTTNQREGDRLPGVIAETVLTLRRRKIDAQVINLSSDGAMIEVDAEARIGDCVSIALGDGSDGKCIVRWIKEGRIGLEFDGYSLDLGRGEDGQFAFRRNQQAKRRIAERAPRQSLVWRATLHAGHDSIPVRLGNVSATGALLEGEFDIEPGTKVMLDFASVGILPSTVRWSEERRIGLLFDKHFDLSLLAICAQPDPGKVTPKIEWVKPEYLKDERSPTSPHASRWEKLTLADLT